MYSLTGMETFSPSLCSLRQTFCHRWHLLTLHFACAATAKPGCVSPVSGTWCTKALMLYMQATGMPMAATNLERQQQGGYWARCLTLMFLVRLASAMHPSKVFTSSHSLDGPPTKTRSAPAHCHKPQPWSLGDESGNSALKHMYESCAVWSGKKKTALLIILGILRFMRKGARVLGLRSLSADFYPACRFTRDSRQTELNRKRMNYCLDHTDM